MDIPTVVIIVLLVLFVRDYLIPVDRWSLTKTTKCPHCIQETMHAMRHHNDAKQHHKVGEFIDDVGDPLYNVREAAKQCEALEDHLEHPNKRCLDCIRKHFLMIEVLLEEAIGLDRYGRYDHLLVGKPQKLRSIISRFNECHDYVKTSQAVRDIRKQFVSATFNIV